MLTGLLHLLQHIILTLIEWCVHLMAHYTDL